ncbi:MAG: hypothetical protein RSD28_05220 [Lachnospiraceae bacterium]
MSIRPVEISGMLQRTQDVSTLKQNENNKPMVEQQTLQTQFAKETIHHMKQVVHAEDTEKKQRKYDAREKGDNEYEDHRKKQKREQKKDGKVIPKGAVGGFDIKI